MPPVRHRRRPAAAGTTVGTPAGATDQQPSPQDALAWAKDLKLNITYRAPSELKPAKRNARTHSKKQIQQIAASIQQFGFVNPILLDRDEGVICGHGRALAARQLGIKEVPTIRLEHLTEVQKRAYIIADNRLAELSGWDEAILSLELKELEELQIDFKLEVTGFDTAEIDRLIEGLLNEPSSSEDEVPELPAEKDAVTQLGDLWILGSHRLICGDAREKATLEHLLGGERAHLVFTDPPYNRPGRSIGGLGRVQHREFAMAKGEMNEAEFIAFLTVTLGNMAAVSVDGAIHYVCIDWAHVYELLTAGRTVYSALKNCCVWAKSNAGMGSFYRSQTEFVLCFKHGTAPHINNFGLGETGRYRSNLWSYPGLNTFGVGRMDELAMHPTVKPTALVADAIRDCSKRGGIVLDAFGGSGTTLIAAERTHRRARLVELDRLYCDVIVHRWQKLTGESARHAETGLRFDEHAAKRASDGDEGAAAPAGEACHV